MVKILASILLAVGLSLAAGPAHAEWRFCNHTSQTAYVAIAWNPKGGWYTKGWFHFLPGECRTVLPIDTHTGPYFFVAQAEEGWLAGGPNQTDRFQLPFCVSDRAFEIYRPVGPENCNTLYFDRAVYHSPPNRFTNLTEYQADPLYAAQRCSDLLGNRDAFVDCWTRHVSSAKQRVILRCLDKTTTPSAFAICANADLLGSDAYRIADCADRYASNRYEPRFLTCITGDRVSTDVTSAFDCAIKYKGDLAGAALCGLGGRSSLSPDQARMFECVRQHNNKFVETGICVAGTQLSSEQKRLVSCVLNNRGRYAQIGLCVMGNRLTPEQQVFASCAIESGGQPYAFVSCVGTQLTVNELEKCLTRGIGGNGCFGENNTAVRAVQNAWKDVTIGIGRENEIARMRDSILPGGNGTIENVVRDPFRCLMLLKPC